MNNRKKNYLEGNTLWVASIFKWLGEDFNDDPLSFVLKYAAENFKKHVEEHNDRIKMKYLDYD